MTKLALTALFAFSSVAFARPSTWTMSCANAKAAVDQAGEIVMNYGYSQKAGYLYELYVNAAFRCESGERAESAYVKTTDSDSCFIGYTCEFSDNN